MGKGQAGQDEYPGADDGSCGNAEYAIRANVFFHGYALAARIIRLLIAREQGMEVTCMAKNVRLLASLYKRTIPHGAFTLQRRVR